MNQNGIDYGENLDNSIEEIERRKREFIQGIIQAKRSSLIKNFVDERRNLVIDLMDRKGEKHLQDNTINEIDRNFLSFFSRQDLTKESSFEYNPSTRVCTIISMKQVYDKDTGRLINKYVKQDFNIDELSDISKEIITSYQNDMKKIKILLTHSITKLTTDECKKTVEAEIERLKKKFDSLCDDRLSVEEMSEAEAIFYNLYKFKKSNTDVYSAIIDGKEIVVDKDSRFYDALDMCYYYYLENGVGLGGTAPKAKDITKADTIIQLDTKKAKTDIIVKQDGAKGIKMSQDSVGKLNVNQDGEDIDIDEFIKEVQDFKDTLHKKQKQTGDVVEETTDEEVVENEDTIDEQEKDEKSDKLLTKSLAEIYQEEHPKESIFDRLSTKLEKKFKKLKKFVFHGSFANYLRYKKSRLKATLGSLFKSKTEVNIEKTKVDGKTVVDTNDNANQTVVNDNTDKTVVDTNDNTDKTVVDTNDNTDKTVVDANDNTDKTVVDETVMSKDLATMKNELLRLQTRLRYIEAGQEKNKKYILQQIDAKKLDKKSLKQELENAGITYDEWITYKKRQVSKKMMLRNYQIKHIKSVQDEKEQKALKIKYGITDIELELEKPMIKEEIDMEEEARRNSAIERQQFIEKVASHYDDYHFQLIMIGGLVNDPNPYGVTIDDVLKYQAENGIGVEQEPKGKVKK